MRKFNKSEIMKNAWRKFRAAMGTFSKCLKAAWAEAKGVVSVKLSGRNKMRLNGKIWKAIIAYCEEAVRYENNASTASKVEAAECAYKGLIADACTTYGLTAEKLYSEVLEGTPEAFIPKRMREAAIYLGFLR